MREAIYELSQEQIEFICLECSITEDELFSMDDEQIEEIVYETMCDIEIEEVTDGPDNERCTLASDIVTILGNTIPRDNGYWDED